MKNDDFRVAPEDGAPISLKKVSNITRGKDLSVLVDSTCSGFVNDDPSLLSITIADREAQGDYFLGLDTALPPYLKKYLEFMYEGESVNIESMCKYGKTNAELKQIIGMIQLFGGSLNSAKKRNVHIRIWLEEPEARLHPKREARMMSLIYKLRDEYGKKDESEKTE